MTTVSTFPFRKRWGYETVDSSVSRRGPISVGDDVWIGTNAIILSGVSIGVGSVIAAGAVVTKDVQPYTVVGGVPARKIKMRFASATRDALIRSRWWELDDDHLKHRIDLLTDGDVQRFIDSLGHLQQSDGVQRSS
ncbi:CatB-related O-acetyltransferase [Janibacter melonis]|uniref:CatB-related O-acetyltransferase n=1 Tax=Janibacter melonis TaxID=262209 RepID=UPI001CD72FE4